ncbi:MAG: hypothetical protein ACRD5J_20540, partial [Nitrososphaeraceae archaeon]
HNFISNILIIFIDATFQIVVIVSMYTIIGMKREKGSYYEGMVVQDIWRYREYVENGIPVESTNTCFGYLTHTIEQLSNEVLK